MQFSVADGTVLVIMARMASTIRTAAPWIERLARMGYVAKGVVHILVGWLAAQAAIGSGGSTTDSSGALRTIVDEPMGRTILGIIAVGLLGYALWRILEAVLDTAGRGTDGKGIAIRVGNAGKAVLYGGLGVEATRLAMGSASGSGGGAEHWTRRLLEQPFGQVLVVIAGLGVIAYGVYQLVRAWRAKLSSDLSIGSIPVETRRWVIRISRFGIGARGVVFLLIGYLLAMAGVREQASNAEGVGGALSILGREPLLLALVGIGLVAYGLYEFLNARYRRIDV